MIEFGKSDLMQKSLDALWLKQRVIANNIANIDTPGYKSKVVKFEELLKDRSSLSKIPEPEIEVNDATALREDGNNVDIDKENIELYRVQIQYEYMARKLSSDFTNLKTVLTEGRR